MGAIDPILKCIYPKPLGFRPIIGLKLELMKNSEENKTK